jgi:AraC-like DNA-binding protein
VSVIYASSILWSGADVPRVPDAWPVALSSALGAAYVGSLWWRLRRRAGRDGRHRLQSFFVGLFAWLGAGVALAALSGHLLATPGFYGVYLSVMTGLMVLVWLASARFPDWLYHLAETPARPEPAKSQLETVDLEQTLARLNHLMDVAQVWRDEALSLASLARQVGITPHQLSELLNVHLGRSFSRYLKSYRVEEAARRLLTEPDTPILDIGLAAGFNSSSAFYGAFRELRGVAPGQFRRKASAPGSPTGPAGE